MALDKQFLKYKLEKIKNKRIFKDQDSESKRQVRIENAKKSQEEADAIHSYLTGMDPIRIFNNRSFLDPDSMPGNLFISDKGELNISQVEPPKSKLAKIMALLSKHKGFGGANKDRGIKLKILKKIFDSLNIIFKRDKIAVGKNLEVKGIVNVGDNIIVGGNGIVNKNLNVIGDGIINKSLRVNKNEIINRNLRVGRNTNILGKLNVGKNTNIRDNLVVGKRAMINNSLSVKRNVRVDGDVTIQGDLLFESRTGKPAQSISPSGYIEISGGMMMQWGFDTSDTDSDHIITFPVEFPNACFSVVVNHQLTGGWNTDEKYGYPITAHSYTRTGFTINRNDTASAAINLNYIAIGN
jgi:carbonic anhydrase/acetyltransferase-like protein (isoleucine patch superfamily)